MGHFDLRFQRVCGPARTLDSGARRLDPIRPDSAVQKTTPDHVVKLRHRCDQAPVTTLGYDSRTIPAARVERFVERHAG